jgi:hypothetical protein
MKVDSAARGGALGTVTTVGPSARGGGGADGTDDGGAREGVGAEGIVTADCFEGTPWLGAPGTVFAPDGPSFDSGDWVARKRKNASSAESSRTPIEPGTCRAEMPFIDQATTPSTRQNSALLSLSSNRRRVPAGWTVCATTPRPRDEMLDVNPTPWSSSAVP